MDASFALWAALIGFVAAAFVVDPCCFQRNHRTPPTLRRAAVWSVVWIAVAPLLGVGPIVSGEGEAGGQLLTGSLLERSLWLDDVFAFALVLRAIFIVAGASLVESLHAILSLSGAILLSTGVRLALDHREEEAPDPDADLGCGSSAASCR